MYCAPAMRETRSNISELVEDVERLRASLPERPVAAVPVLVVVCGLPGTGKSYFSRRLVSQVPLLILESDVLRKVLFPDPKYTAFESKRLFRACYALIDDLLGHEVPVLLDATNLVEGHRESLYDTVARRGARLVLVHLKAPPDVVYGRLKSRSNGADPEDNSGADWQVYQRMRSAAQPIKRSHFVFDTSGDISPAINRVVQEIRHWVSTD